MKRVAILSLFLALGAGAYWLLVKKPQSERAEVANRIASMLCATPVLAHEARGAAQWSRLGAGLGVRKSLNSLRLYIENEGLSNTQRTTLAQLGRGPVPDLKEWSAAVRDDVKRRCPGEVENARAHAEVIAISFAGAN